jgi:hypothetical protein
MGTACSVHREGNVYNILVGRPEGKGPLGRLKSKWENNIKMDLKNILGKCGLDSSSSGPSGSLKITKFLDLLSILLSSQENYSPFSYSVT